MPKIIFPLQAEIERARKEACELLLAHPNPAEGPVHDVALRYHKAISQIAKICEDRKRF